MRAYEIVVDGRRIGSLRRGKSRSVNLPAGRHEVQAKIDWSGSEPLVVDLSQGETVTVRVSPNRVVDGFMGMFSRTGWIRISIDPPRPMLNTSDFVTLLIARVPEADSVVSEHLEDNFGELLLHLLVADMRRLMESAWLSSDHGLLARCLEVFDRGLSDGDVAVENAVAVSFIEDSGPWDSSNKAYLSVWPPALTEEARQQQEWRPSP